MANAPKVRRELVEMELALRKHLELLAEYSARAFQHGDEAFYGEVAGKLRLLVYGSRTNKPLLLELMERHGISSPIAINKPRGMVTMTLPEYLGSLACVQRVPSGELVEMTNMDFLATWAHQCGAAHEDWEIKEVFAVALKNQIELGGRPAAAAGLRAIANTVLWVGKQFLEQRRQPAN